MYHSPASNYCAPSPQQLYLCSFVNVTHQVLHQYKIIGKNHIFIPYVSGVNKKLKGTKLADSALLPANSIFFPSFLRLTLKYFTLVAKYLNLACFQSTSATFISRVYVKYCDLT
jgi:hypothetical protein